MTRKTLAALAVAMALVAPGLASATATSSDVIVDGRTGAVTRSLAVSVADLDLGSTHGYRMADSRITRAAKQVCGYVSGSIIPVTSDYRTCFTGAQQDGRSELDSRVQRAS